MVSIPSPTVYTDLYPLTTETFELIRAPSKNLIIGANSHVDESSQKSSQLEGVPYIAGAKVKTVRRKEPLL